MTPRIEGYWRQHRDDPAGLPWPEPTPGWGEAEFLRQLRAVEKTAEVLHFRGWSYSRLTGKLNGSREYVLGNWRWPEGLGHYIEHGVRPTTDFEAFITATAAQLPQPE